MIMKRTVLTNLQLLDGVAHGILADQVLVIENDEVAWVGPRGAWDQKTDPRDEVVDLQGMYVLPGLWDMHMHLDFRVHGQVGPSIAEDTMFSYRRALTLLHSGVTSLRLPGSANGIDFALRDGIERGDYIGPRILTAGEGITSTGGHGSIDGKGCDGPYEFRRAARQVVSRGADLVKIMVTGGIMGRHEASDAPQTMPDEVQAVVEVAHNWGKHVSGHIASSEAAIMCAELGVDTIEHGYFLDENAIQVMKKCGSAYIPTLGVTSSPDYWKEIGAPDWAVEKVKRAAITHRRAVEMAMEAGLTIALGSDLPTAHVNGTIGIVNEMEALAQLGASPETIIHWATQVPAQICGLGHKVGTLEQGKQADLIAVPKNPYESVSNLRNVSFVMARGTIVRDDITSTRRPSLLAGHFEG